MSKGRSGFCVRKAARLSAALPTGAVLAERPAGRQIPAAPEPEWEMTDEGGELAGLG